PGSRVNADGSFSLPDVGDGTYSASTDGESKDCYVKDVEYAGRASLEEGLIVARGSAAMLEITISSRGGRVQGTVTDDEGLPSSGIYVALVPDSETRRSKHRRVNSHDAQRAQTHAARSRWRRSHEGGRRQRAGPAPQLGRDPHPHRRVPTS